MTELFSLGKIYPSDFLKPDEQPRCEPVELKLVMEDNGFVHLENVAPKECMWGEKYWYRSGINKTMKRELKDIVDSTLKVLKTKAGDTWLDIASNDGTLLSFVPEYMIKIGIDPAGDSFKNECEQHADFVIQDYFTAEKYKQSKYGHKKPKVITCIAIFYDLEKPDEFLKDVHEVMDDDGLIVFQLSYTPLMLDQLEFSNICHEHYAYYSFFNFKELLEENSFKVMDVQLNNTNAGSFRVYAMKENGASEKFGSQTHRDVCDFRIRSLLWYENFIGLDEPDVWLDFYDRIKLLKDYILAFVHLEKNSGKTLYGYGASTKFNTVLQYVGLDSTTITAIADRSPVKHGLRTIGTNIPIVSEEVMREAKPDYLLVGPAHFISEFKEREHELLKSGTKFICIMPKFEIIGL